MFRIRMIPTLLLRGSGFYKTIQFQNHRYLGDPINIIKIFNDKEVPEIVVLDILASTEGRSPNLELISRLASECFMPLAYGGGIRDIDTIRQILRTGIEKVVINSYAVENPGFIAQAAAEFGSSTIVVSIDSRKCGSDYEVFTHGGQRRSGVNVKDFAVQMSILGAGELLLNSVDRDGMMSGYDTQLIETVASAVQIPVVACGGAGNTADFVAAVKSGASAAAAGSIFVYKGKLKAVLIGFPSDDDLETAFQGV